MVPEDKLEALLAGLRPLLDASPGVMFVTETFVSRPEYFNVSPSPQVAVPQH